MVKIIIENRKAIIMYLQDGELERALSITFKNVPARCAQAIAQIPDNGIC